MLRRRLSSVRSLPAAWLTVGVALGTGLTIFGIVGLVLIVAGLIGGFVIHRRSGWASTWALVTGSTGMMALLIGIDTQVNGHCGPGHAANVPIIGGGEYVGLGGGASCREIVSDHWAMVFLFTILAVFAACWPTAKRNAAAKLKLRASEQRREDARAARVGDSRP